MSGAASKWRWVALLVTAALSPLPGMGQEYPAKPIRIVIPYPPGGVDIHVRLMLPSLNEQLGQVGVIDYRPGASGLIGTEYVANADPDGYTLLWTASNPWVVTPAMRRNTPYDPIKSFTPITVVTEGVNVIVANVNFPASNLTELFAYARKNPGKVAWATSGIGSSWHLDAENMNRLAGTRIVHAPFKGFGPMFPAMFSGQPPVGLITYATSHKLVETGKLKYLGAMSTKAKVQSMIPPGLQNVKDVLPGFVASSSWVGVGAPAGLPREIVLRLNKAIIQAIQLPELQKRFAEDRIVATGDTPEEFAELVKTDYEQAVRSVRESGIPLLQ